MQVDNKVSVVVPTMNRADILKMTLESLDNQTLLRDKYEVIVVNDGGREPNIDPDNYGFDLVYLAQENKGPAAARNTGAKVASGNILHFIGDDCVADRNLLFRIYYNHFRDARDKAVQGYTVWHKDIAGSEFQQFLINSGIQANWRALMDENGDWLYEISPSYCLTTNYSIHRRHFENLSGYRETYHDAAWEDLEFGYRAQQQQIPAVFDPGAVNYHHHRYNLAQFVERQKTEGYWRPRICLDHPEMTHSLLPPQDIREAEGLDLDELIAWAGELDNIYGDNEITNKRYSRWQRVLQVASLKGITKGLDNFVCPALNAVKYMPNNEAANIVVAGVSALERGDGAYAIHTIGWLLKSFTSAYLHNYAGEVYLHLDDVHNARMHFEKGIEFEPTDWGKRRLREIKEDNL